MSKASVLIVEDEPDIAELIQFHIEREGLAARIIGSGRKAVDEVKRRPPDLIVLDLMLPDLDGLELCRRWNRDEAARRIPILIVSAKGEESDIVAGLELGADDYITKPFSPRILIARVRRILRRVDPMEHGAMENRRLNLGGGRLEIDVDRYQVSVDGHAVDLTRTEFEILRCLAARPGFVRTRDQIIAAVHGGDTVLSSRTVDVHVTSLRKKLGVVAPMIGTVRGVGYRLNESMANVET